MTVRTDQGMATGAKLDPAGRSFIEVQFPVSKLSKESYDERKGAQGQALTSLGKWWGRKPLALVRAILLGILLPATIDPEEDRLIFLILMGMDDESLWQRRRGPLPVATVYEQCTPREKEELFSLDSERPRWKTGVGSEDKMHIQRRVFFRMSYERKVSFCDSIEESSGPGPELWPRINSHLGTNAFGLSELVKELGEHRFGRIPRIGDAFSGGGSIPFAAARLGCEAFGSDLSPVASLLTFGALKIIGGGKDVVEELKIAREYVYEKLLQQVDDWGIDRNDDGWIADAYLYCSEVRDPVTGWRVPLAPTWVIAKRAHQVIARLIPNHADQRFDIEIVTGATSNEIEQAQTEGTWQGGMQCPVDSSGQWLNPSERQTISAEQLRGRNGLRLWDNDDIIPRPDDVFQERLYCIRWLDPSTGKRYYKAPTSADFAREEQVISLLRGKFAKWQANGYIPSRRIEPGNKTSEPIRTRGWSYWHHLFNPRQLLIAGLYSEQIDKCVVNQSSRAGLLLSLGSLINISSKLSRWHSARDQSVATYYNQALNTLFNYACRPASLLESVVSPSLVGLPLVGHGEIQLRDARQLEYSADVWITDPGYGDVILYDELSEYFLAWYDKHLLRNFPGWYSDSKRALSVKGEGETFRMTLVECYKHLAHQTTSDGFQVVMFTHQDPEVWADLALVLWASGLRVSAAWTIATETGTSGVRQGNYVQGTVVMVLRKRQGDLRGDMSDLYPEIQTEVKDQLEAMLALDPKDDPNFGDADYQLAAYAAALRVLTGYSAIDEIDVERELRRTRKKGEKSPVTGLIERAVRIASDILVPERLDASVWRRLGPEERLYLKGIQVEARGESREGVYQELARGYGATEYREMLASRAANKARLKTPSEFAGRDLRGLAAGGFAGSLLRQTLFAIYTTATNPDAGPRAAKEYLRRELPDYWNSRETILALLRYLTVTPVGLAHWEEDMKAAQLLLGSVENDAM